MAITPSMVMGHVDQHAVALDTPWAFERVGKLAHAGQQLFVGDLGDRAIIGFENDGGLVLGGRADVLVEAVGTGVQFAIIEPAEKRALDSSSVRVKGFPLHIGAAPVWPRSLRSQLQLLCTEPRTRPCRRCAQL